MIGDAIFAIVQVIVTIFAVVCIIGLVTMLFTGTVPSSEDMGEGRFW